MEHNQNLQLPVSVVGVTDVNRLDRELVAIDEFLHQGAIREPGTAMKLPKTSKLFDELISTNGLNLLQEADRSALRNFLRSIQTNAPRLHISFSADPSPLFLQRLMNYLREKINPKVLVQVGLQPNIGAGCVVRSTNKVFDLSLREDFRKKRGLLMQHIQKLEAHDTKQEVQA
jgi:hypothetical protein